MNRQARRKGSMSPVKWGNPGDGIERWRRSARTGSLVSEREKRGVGGLRDSPGDHVAEEREELFAGVGDLPDGEVYLSC